MNRTLPILIIFGIGLLIALPVLAVEFEVQYPEFGDVKPGGGPASWVRYIFFLALALTSIAAVGSLIYAGIVWMTSASSERVGEAKKRIWASVTGIVLVAGSVIILRTINPDLVSLRQPTIKSIEEGFRYQYGGGPQGGSCETNNGCPADQFCLRRGPENRGCVYSYTGEGGKYDCALFGSRACGGDLYCSPETGMCEKVPSRCRNDSDCKDESVFYCADTRPEYNVSGTCKRRK